MAEGLLKSMSKGRFEVESAGTRPSVVRPEAIAALGEIGIDISGNRSKSVGEFDGREFDFVLTVCDNAKENCPFFPARTRVVHRSFDDPADALGDFELRVAEFRRVRDEMRRWFESEFIGLISK